MMSQTRTIDNNNNMNNTIATTTSLSYGSGIAGIIAGLSLNDWLAIGGFMFMALTYFTNLAFRLYAEKRDRELHELKKLGKL